jgi:phosphatidylserine/phosphatidylglycerophosphate/cardiolipin synthase-like enzyme
MAKRNTTSSSGPRSVIGAVLGAILIVVLLIFSKLTGIDLIGTVSGTPIATNLAATTGVSINVSTATPLAGGTQVANAPSGAVAAINVPLGFGAQKGFWQVYFTAPTGNSNRATYTAGIDTALAAMMGGTSSTMDIAAYEFNNPILTQAVLDAHNRGVRVRMVTDNNDGIGDDDTTLHQLVDAGIPVVPDTRGDLMHDKFVILDSAIVWTGSWNYTINDTYRNNNNALVLRSQKAVQDYQAEFDEMFTGKQFGPRSPANNPNPSFSQDGTPIQIFFAPEDRPVPTMVSTINQAQRSVRFMAFSFTLDELGAAMLQRAQAGVQVQGIFETTGSETRFSELTPLYCAGLPVRQDGNNYILHHKVIIIDDSIVITGSFNLSASATDNNDENLLIIRDPDLAGQYTAEFNRRWAEAKVPGGLLCS